MAKSIPTEVKLHQQSKVLEITFADGAHFNLPCEYLRVFSPSAEVRGHGPGQEVLQYGKKEVNIAQIVPVGNYAVGLHFDDGHDSGIYDWDTLYHLGEHYEDYWQAYLKRLEKEGLSREPARADNN